LYKEGLNVLCFWPVFLGKINQGFEYALHAHIYIMSEVLLATINKLIQTGSQWV
jgi:hypothetical protein